MNLTWLSRSAPNIPRLPGYVVRMALAADAVGIPNLDAQHLLIGKVVGVIADALAAGRTELAPALFDELAHLVRRHFATEETLLASGRSVAVERHRAEHQRFLQHVDGVVRAARAGGATDWRAALAAVERSLVEHVTAWDAPDLRAVKTTWSCGGKVLVVDDSPTALMQAETRLRKLGFQVIGRREPLGTTATVMTERPGLVLLDLEMPGLDGRALCRQLREATGVRVILHSSSAELEAGVQSSGAAGGIPKTADDRLFARRFAQVCSRMCHGGGDCSIAGIREVLPGRSEG